MSGTVRLSASTAYGRECKQFVARITGRHPKFTFEYVFIGTRSGKRNGDTEARVDDAGLYMERDIDRKGAVTDTFKIVADGLRGLDYNTVSREEAMTLAKGSMTVGALQAAYVESEIARLERVAAKAAELDQDSELTIEGPIGDLVPGKYKRWEVVAARTLEIERLRALLPGLPALESPPFVESVPVPVEGSVELDALTAVHGVEAVVRAAWALLTESQRTQVSAAVAAAPGFGAVNQPNCMCLRAFDPRCSIHGVKEPTAHSAAVAGRQ